MAVPEIPERYQNMYKLAMSGKSRSAAIRCHCLECVCWSMTEVQRCHITTCPLHAYRNQRVSYPPGFNCPDGPLDPDAPDTGGLSPSIEQEEAP